MSAIHVALQGISKQFGVTRALDGVTFDIRSGSIHAIVGENGAGKSTLMNVLSGAIPMDRGEIRLDGDRIDIDSPRRARALGIAMIHQELTVLDNLTVAQNILLGHEPARAGIMVDRRRLNALASKQLGRLEVALDPETDLRRLPVGQRQMVEIAKALSLHARLLIMDEPTSSLSKREVDKLFSVIASLKREGITTLYISHRLEEVFALCDAITVLRDGREIDTGAIADFDIPQVIHLMVGSDIESLGRRTSKATDEPILRVTGLSRPPDFRDVDLLLHRGEVLGLFGLLGAGRTEFAQALFGLEPATTGRIEVAGRQVEIDSTRAAREAGIAYAPEDRKRQGIFSNQSVRRNLIAMILRRCSRLLWVRAPIADAVAERSVERLSIKTPNLWAALEHLSGGNQQKVVLARWIETRPTLLILDEPTRGIDVKAKAHIYALIDTLAAEGIAILLISSELPELFGVSDRIAVMRAGGVEAVMPTAETDTHEVMSYATGARRA